MEREGGDVAMPEADVPPPPPSGGAQDYRPATPPVLPAGGEMATSPASEALTPSRRRSAKATSVPRPLEAGAASSLVPDVEATSTAPTEWVCGGGTCALNRAVLDVQANSELRPLLFSSATWRSLIRERPFGYVSYFSVFDSCTSRWGHASAPTGCSPRVSGRLLSRRRGTSIDKLRVLTSSDIFIVGLS